MECSKSARNLSAYIDGFGTVDQQREIAQHLRVCSECAQVAEQFRSQRQAMKALPARIPPPLLDTRLRVLASRERQRRQSRLSVAHAFNAWRERTSFSLRNLMRPLALPVAGGIFSAAVLFSTILPDLVWRIQNTTADVPTALLTQAVIKDAAPMGIAEDEIVVDCSVDDHGHMTDYRVIRGKNLLTDEEMRRSLENKLMFTTFTPATQFGQPTAGTVRVFFQTTKVVVRG
jgi:hypothetical protein